MKTLIPHILLFAFVLSFAVSNGQGLDDTPVDTTNLVFGPNTVKYYKEADLLRHNPVEFRIDTTPRNLNQVAIFKDYQKPRQHLGPLGSPSKSLYFDTPTTLGHSLGRSALDHYSYQKEDVQYYDTYSPFASIDYVQGLSDQEYIEAKFARSVSDNIGLGFAFKRMGAKQWYGTGAGTVPFTDHYSTYINGYAMTKDRRLKVFANYRWMQHEVFENGGIYSSQNTDTLSYNAYEHIAITNLSTEGSSGDFIKTFDKRNAWHLGVTFSLLDTNNTLNLVYQFDRQKQVNDYYDDHYSEEQEVIGEGSSPNAVFSNRNYYESITGVPRGFLIDSSFVHDSTVFLDVSHEFGLNGFRKFLGYYAYYRHRNWEFHRNDTLITVGKTEDYFGAELWLDKNIKNFTASAKFEVGSYDQSIIDLKTKIFWLDIAFSKVNVLPSQLEFEYVGNVNTWNFEDFNNKDYKTLKFALDVPVGQTFKFIPFYERSDLDNYIYFNENAVPTQLSERIGVNAFGLYTEFKWKRFFVSEFLKSFEVAEGSDVLRAPRWYSHTQLKYHFPIFNRTVHLQFGTDLFYRSAHQALHYMPLYQQYYVSNRDYKLQDYFVWDAYVSASVKTFDVYLKWNHINQLINGGGYFVTPDYIGLNNSFEFGINWKFYK